MKEKEIEVINGMYQQTFRYVIYPQNILLMMRTESTDILTIDYLSVLAKTEQERYLWRQLLSSREQYYNWMRSLFRYMTSRDPEVDQETFQRPESYQNGLQTQMDKQQIRLLQLHNLIANATNPIIIQYLQIILSQSQYEELLLRQIMRFSS